MFCVAATTRTTVVPTTAMYRRCISPCPVLGHPVKRDKDRRCRLDLGAGPDAQVDVRDRHPGSSKDASDIAWS